VWNGDLSDVVQQGSQLELPELSLIQAALLPKQLTVIGYPLGMLQRFVALEPECMKYFVDLIGRRLIRVPCAHEPLEHGSGQSMLALGKGFQMFADEFDDVSRFGRLQ